MLSKGCETVTSNLNDALVSVVGGGGFVGRYVVQRLLAVGYRVRVVQRDPRRAQFLRPLGSLGQTQFVHGDVRDAASIERALAGSTLVINLAGSFDDMDAVQGQGAAHVARAAVRGRAAHLLHMSAIGADADSPARYGRSKAAGEAAVLDAMPDATILRPSIIFGREDQFINRFAAMVRMSPVVPVVAPNTGFQPVYVGDVAAAAVAAAEGARGGVFELGGPQRMTMRQLLEWIAAQTGRSPLFVPIPDGVAAAMARLTGWLPGAPITYDQWLMLQRDNVVAEGAAGLSELGVTPTALASVADGWLVQYRRHGRFAVS